MEKLDILNFEILLGAWLKSQTQKMLEKHGVVTASFPGFSPTHPHGRVRSERERDGQDREPGNEVGSSYSEGQLLLLKRIAVMWMIFI